MQSRSAWKVVAALGAALGVSACTPPPEVGDAIGGNVVVSNAFSLAITGGSVIPAGNVVGNRVVVLYTVTQDGTPATTNMLAAAGIAFRFTAAALSGDPVAGGNQLAWKALLRTGGQTLVSNPLGGPGTPPAQVEANVRQPGADSTGTVETLPDGSFRYTFANVLEASYDPGETFRIGGWLRGALVAPGSASTYDFVPGGGTPRVRDTVLDANCNACHGLLVAHDGRHGVRLCLTCHTVQDADPDTIDPAAMALAPFTATAASNPNPLDLGRMVHRIHRGKFLPTLYRSSSSAPAPPLNSGSAMPLPFSMARVPAPTPLLGQRYSIVGYQSTEFIGGLVVMRDDNEQPARLLAEGVGYPRELRDCAACHGGAPQSDEQFNAISRRTCGGCHPDVWFGAGSTDPVHFAHLGGPQANDTRCAACHLATGSPVLPEKLYADTRDVHVPPYLHPNLDPPQVDVVQVANLTPGHAPTVVFKAYDQGGTITPLNTTTYAGTSPVPRALTRVAITISGPTTDYATGNFASTNTLPATEVVPLTAVADGSGQFSYAFANVLAPTSSGTWAIGMEARRTLATVHYNALGDTFPWPYTGETITESARNRIQYVDTATGSMWTGAPVARRQVVTLDACNRCHGSLSLHGGLRKDIEYCVMCHAPDRTDWGRRPKAANGNVNLASVASGNAFGTYDNREERSVNMKVMIHRIHTGESSGVVGLDASAPFAIYGNPGGSTAVFFFDDVRFPNNLANCRLCHVAETFRIEAVSADAAPTVANETSTIQHSATSRHAATEIPVRPIQSACLGCHDTGPGRAHAANHTVGTVEACATCHGGTTGRLAIPVVHGLAP